MCYFVMKYKSQSCSSMQIEAMRDWFTSERWVGQVPVGKFLFKSRLLLHFIALTVLVTLMRSQSNHFTQPLPAASTDKNEMHCTLFIYFARLLLVFTCCKKKRGEETILVTCYILCCQSCIRFISLLTEMSLLGSYR